MTSRSVTEVAEAGGRETEGGWSVPLHTVRMVTHIHVEMRVDA